MATLVKQIINLSEIEGAGHGLILLLLRSYLDFLLQTLHRIPQGIVAARPCNPLIRLFNDLSVVFGC